MPVPELMVVAECEEISGATSYLKVGGTAEDYYTLLETVHPDGRRDEGGMGGPVLDPGRLLKVHTGRTGDGDLRVVVRADSRVQRLFLESEAGEWGDILSVGEDDDLGVTFFAFLLPWKSAVASIRGADADGEALPP